MFEASQIDLETTIPEGMSEEEFIEARTNAAQQRVKEIEKRARQRKEMLERQKK